MKQRLSKLGTARRSILRQLRPKWRFQWFVAGGLVLVTLALWRAIFRGETTQAQASLRRRKAILQSLQRLEGSNWSLPQPVPAIKFGSMHDCYQGNNAPLYSFFEGQSWWNSTDHSVMYQFVKKATFVYTQFLFLSLFDQHGDSDWMLRNFACHARRMKVKPFIVVRSYIAQQHVNEYPPLIGVYLPELMKQLAAAFRVQTVSIHMLKWPSVLAALYEGAKSVVVSDFDVLWLQSPVHHLRSMGWIDLAVAVRAQGAYLADSDALDTVRYWDEVERRADEQHVPACCQGGHLTSAGQVFLRGPRVQTLLHRIIGVHQRFLSVRIDRTACRGEHNPMQWGLFEHCSAWPSRCRLLDPRLFADAELLEYVHQDGTVTDKPFSVRQAAGGKGALLNTMREVGDECLADLA